MTNTCVDKPFIFATHNIFVKNIENEMKKVQICFRQLLNFIKKKHTDELKNKKTKSK